MRTTRNFVTLIMLAAFGALLCTYSQLPSASAADPGTGDWPMWGGTPDRNMISNMKGLPTSWDVKAKIRSLLLIVGNWQLGSGVVG